MIMSIAVNARIPLDLYILPNRSAKVEAPSFFPSLRVLGPNTMKATTRPTNRFRKHSHNIDIPCTAACPPKPMMADALRNVAP